jgi:hypothetical protein
MWRSIFSVIPGRREVASPESTMMLSEMDSGPASFARVPE